MVHGYLCPTVCVCVSARSENCAVEVAARCKMEGQLLRGSLMGQ